MYLVVIGERVMIVKCNDDEANEISECLDGDVYEVDEILDVVI